MTRSIRRLRNGSELVSELNQPVSGQLQMSTSSHQEFLHTGCRNFEYVGIPTSSEDVDFLHMDVGKKSYGLR